jgi:hypothetical protein
MAENCPECNGAYNNSNSSKRACFDDRIPVANDHHGFDNQRVSVHDRLGAKPASTIAWGGGQGQHPWSAGRLSQWRVKRSTRRDGRFSGPWWGYHVPSSRTSTHITTRWWRIKPNMQEAQSTMVSRWLDQIPKEESLAPTSARKAWGLMLDKKKVRSKVWRPKSWQPMDWLPKCILYKQIVLSCLSTDRVFELQLIADVIIE